MTQNCELLLCADCSLGRTADNSAQTNDAVDQLRRALPGPVTLRVVPCMNICDAPVTVALQGPGRATYIFKGVDPQSDHQDLLSTCAAYLSACDGWIEDAHVCGRLRHCLVARVPCLTAPREK